MEKNDVFAFTAPNGVEVTAVIITANCNYNDDEYIGTHYLCYAQNRIFTFREYANGNTEYGSIIVEHCIIPECDRLLEDYQHQLDMADDYVSREY